MNDKRHLKAKLLGSSMQLLKLEQEKVELQRKFTKTVRDRILFDLPMKGGVAVKRLPDSGSLWQNRGVVWVYLDEEKVHEVPLQYYDRFEHYLSKTKNFEEFDAMYRELVHACFTNQLLSWKIPRSYYDQR